MIFYRPFRNSDSPAMADIWRSQPARRGLMQPITPSLLESLVFAKPYFDPRGLILAFDGATPVGFAHAGFGPNESKNICSTQWGVVCLVMVRPEYRDSPAADELLARAEAYLRQCGAQVLYGGGIRPLDGFYLGLYGGSELPGVLDSDLELQQLFTRHGYREIDRTLVLQCPMKDFHGRTDRQQLQLRRRTLLQTIVDPPPSSWWESWTHGCFDRTRYEIVSRDGGPPMGAATFWNMEPLASSWGLHAAGLVELAVDEKHRREGVATYLLGEAFRQLQSDAVSLVEVQVMRANTSAISLYEKLGFRQVDSGAVLRKE